MHRKQIVWLLMLGLMMPLVALSQSFDFKIYNTSEGLADNDIIALAQDKNDYVWMATDEGLIRFDGIEYNVFTTANSLAHNYINCLHFDHNGRLWIGHKNGLISYYEDGQFNKLDVEGASQLISGLTEDEKGAIWAVDQKQGLIRIDQSGAVKTFFDRKKFGRNNYTAIKALSPTELLVGTARKGLFVFSFDSDFEEVEIEKVNDIPSTWINTIVKSKNSNKYWIGTRDKGFYSYSEGQQTGGVRHITDNNLCKKFNIESEEVTDIYEEAEGHILISTIGNGVIRLIFDPVTGEFTDSFKYSSNNGLSNNDVTDILCDREGNYWFGTKGSGVSLLVNQYFVFYKMHDIGFHYNAKSVFKDGKNLWIGLERGLVLTDPMCFDVKYYDAQYGGIPNDVIVDFYKSDDGTLWVATANKGLYYKDKNSDQFKKRNYFNDQLALRINDLTGFGNQLLLATQRGLFVIDLASNQIKNYEIKDGLSHNNINFVYVDGQKNIWVGPKDGGLCLINPALDRIERHPVMDEVAMDVTGMAEDDEGNLWISTKGEGVICYVNGSVTHQISSANGLKKDFCYGIQRDIKKRLWVIHDGGLSRIEPSKDGNHAVSTYGHNDDLGNVFYQVCQDDDGTIWFTSNEGVVNYLPENDRPNTVAPILNLTALYLNDEQIPLTNRLKLRYPYGKGYYKLRLDFRAISFKNPEDVSYQIKIEEDGEDSESVRWSNLNKVNNKEIDYLRPGSYKIRLRAFNADGQESSLSRVIAAEVAPPIWFTTWFLILAGCLLVLAIYGLMKFREKALIRQKLMLQKEVASQTVVLREQKAEIERKNRDITDSINYAKKIQSSILPSMDDLMNVFPESFVYFLPRDIVSGDFYWFNRSKDYFIACCADCTGHGVPGAFMSMIGTTILNDIYRLASIDSPAAILEKLDEEVKKLLQKNQGNESMDGMDISVLEVHIPTRRVRLASAKRPVYLMIDNELTVYKGSRRSIGDSYDAQLSPFVNLEYNCKQGDQIYMFSDGYPDQFGGPCGKKFMKVGVQNLIQEMYHQSGEEQFATVKNNFEKWMGDLEQIDDVLFIGVKL